MKFKSRQSGGEAVFLRTALLSHFFPLLTLSVRHDFDIFTKKIQYMKSRINKSEGSYLHYQFNIYFIWGILQTSCNIYKLHVPCSLLERESERQWDVSPSMKIHGQLKKQSEIKTKFDYKSMGTYNHVCYILLSIGLFPDIMQETKVASWHPAWSVLFGFRCLRYF